MMDDDLFADFEAGPGDAPDPLAAALAERDEARDTVAAVHQSAAGRLRALLLAGDPDVPEELVTGETMDEVEASFAEAQALVARVREAVGASAPAAAVSAGAPGRVTVQPRTPFEKIRAGLAALD